MAGVLGIVGAGDDHHVGSPRPHGAHHVVDCRGIDGDDHSRRLVDAAALQEQRVGGIAEIDCAAQLAPTLDAGGVTVGHNVGNLVLVEHVADELAHPSVTDDDHPLGMIGRW